MAGVDEITLLSQFLRQTFLITSIFLEFIEIFQKYY